MGRAYALIDGNSFYCSCERVFDAKLEGRPFIVLSNDDTARSFAPTTPIVSSASLSGSGGKS